MRYAPVMALMALLLATTAFAGANPNATLPLHGKSAFEFACTGYAPVDCLSNRPVVNVPAGPVTVFLFVMNYANVAGVQTAFTVPAAWAFATGTWNCQVGQLSAVTPAPPWGATAGSITTAFTCLNGPALGVIGMLLFSNAASGCVEQVQSSFPNGTHVLDCAQGVDQIPESQGARLGKICVGTQGGFDACDPLIPVEPATWGSIKAQYN
jgi:hypothetical protein